MSWLALLLQQAVFGWYVEDWLKFLVPAEFFVVTPTDTMPMKLTENSNGCLNEERHRVVLERCAVAILHQEVDQARRCVCVFTYIFEASITYR